MNVKDKQELHSLLSAKKQDLIEVIADENEVLRSKLNSESEDSNVDFNHPADMIQGDPDYEKDIRIIEGQRRELALVTQALERLDRDDYGRCEECDKQIPLARLKAIPFAQYCISCQEASEDTSTARTVKQEAGVRRGSRGDDEARGGHLGAST